MQMIDAGLFVLNALLDVLAMLWRFIQFLFGRIPSSMRPPPG
jgi:hypothetical protein